MKFSYITTTIILFFLTVMSINGCVMSDMAGDMAGTVQNTFFTKKYDTISYHKSEEYNNSSIQRVLLLPFTIETSREKVIDNVTEAFFIELQKIARFWKVTDFKPLV